MVKVSLERSTSAHVGCFPGKTCWCKCSFNASNYKEFKPSQYIAGDVKIVQLKQFKLIINPTFLVVGR